MHPVSEVVPKALFLLCAFALCAVAAGGRAHARDAAKTLVEFRDHRSWHYTSVEAAARVSQLNTGEGEPRLEVLASSGAFKFYSEPYAGLIVSDAAGRVIDQRWVNELAMAMGRSVDQRHRKSNRVIEPGAFHNAAYAFFHLKFCAWQQSFARNAQASNGCYKSQISRDMDRFAQQLPDHLTGVEVRVGERFEVLGWKGFRLR